MSVSSDIQQLYVAFFNRPADPLGLDYWTIQANKSGGVAAVANAFSASAEYKAVFGNLNTGDTINLIYQNLFGRNAEAAGLTFWGKAIDNGLPLSTVAQQIAAGAQNADLVAVQNKVTYATAFTAAVDTAPEILGYSGDAANAVAKAALLSVTTAASLTTATAAIDATIVAAVAAHDGIATGNVFALTINQDSGAAFAGTPGADIFNAPIVSDLNGGFSQTLQSFDTINGGSGNDTLNATLISAVVTTPQLVSVENVVVSARAAGTSLDLSASTGVTSINVTGGTFTTTVAGVGAAALAVSNEKLDNTFNGSTATNESLTLTNVGTKAAPNTVALGFVGAAASTLSINSNNSFVAVTGDAAKTVNIAATGANVLTIGAAAGSATTVNVTGTGTLDLTGSALTVATSVTAGDGGLKAIISNATAGAVTVTTGAGVDSITVDGTGAAAVSLGAGNDTVTFSTAPTAGATIDGGAGADTIALAAADYTSVSAFTAPQLALITNFEVLGITDGGGLATSTLDLSKIAGITGVTFNGVATGGTATITNVGANATVTEAGLLGTNNGTAVIVLKDATGAADVLNLNLNASLLGAAGVATAVTTTIAGVETINVATSTTDAVTTHTGGYNLVLTDTKLVNLSVTGNQAFAFASTTTETKLATVNGSGSLAAVSFDVSAAASTSPQITVTGSAKADTFTVSNGAIVTGGAGTDSFVIKAPTSGQTYSAITDLTSGESLTFLGGAAGTVAATAFTAAKITLAATAVFQDFLDAAAAKTTGAVSYFQFAGDTYVVEDAATATTTFQNGTDVVVKLTGLLDLSTATFAAGVITLA